MFFFFKQKTAYEMRISDWRSDVCSSDLVERGERRAGVGFNGSAFTLGRQRGTARAGQGADDRVMFVRRPLGEARFDEGGGEIAHAVLRNANGLLDLERAPRYRQRVVRGKWVSTYSSRRSPFN